MALIYGPRKGFNYEKSYNPKKNGAPPIHQIRKYKNGARLPTVGVTFNNKFTGRNLNLTDFHKEVTAIKNSINLVDPHAWLIGLNIPTKAQLRKKYGANYETSLAQSLRR